MLARIAATVEAIRSRVTVKDIYGGVDLTGRVLPMHLIAVGVEASLEYLKPAAVFARTIGGTSARRLATFRFPVWTVGITPHEKTAQDLLFSSGVVPVHMPDPPASWNTYAREWVRDEQLSGAFAILTQRSTPGDPESSHRMEIVDL